MNNPRGPKSKYKPEMCETIKKVAQEGGHIAAMCAAIGIESEDTFHRWKKEYPEFMEAYQASKLLSKAFYEKILLMGALGQIKGFNFNSIAMLMNNKFSEEYTRSANGGSTIEITNNTLNLNSDQLDYQIAQKLEQLKLMGITLPTGLIPLNAE